ncbi:hypothetical protein Dsin_019946 [Dipteronia sinensis]|uniref:Uncharacterized protein n=1 Tax=Dipteronia sinensis TaxID=43782 RepID=A0AAE0E380_9ROSI|nr:hypothetical protein Dsin_019946 [Dipteronia sinensis]
MLVSLVSRVNPLQLLNTILVENQTYKGLMYVIAEVNGKEIRAMLDTSATNNFVAQREVDRVGSKLLGSNSQIKAVNSSTIIYWYKFSTPVEFNISTPDSIGDNSTEGSGFVSSSIQICSGETELIEGVIESLTKAARRMKKYADHNCLALEFNACDNVLLKIIYPANLEESHRPNIS